MARPARGGEGGGRAAFVLAGGQSSRMGRDKALVDFGGQPLLVRALDILRGAGLAPSIAGARTALEHYAPVVPDATRGKGPLGGICAALASTSCALSVFLSVDLPLIPSSLIEYLVRHAEISGRLVTLASVNGFPQTFPVVVHKDCLPVFRAELETARGGCFTAFRTATQNAGQPLGLIAAEFVAQTGAAVSPAALAPAFWFLNVNTAADLERAQAWCG